MVCFVSERLLLVLGTNLKFAELKVLVLALLAYLQMSGGGFFLFTVCVGSSLVTRSYGDKNDY